MNQAIFFRLAFDKRVILVVLTIFTTIKKDPGISLPGSRRSSSLRLLPFRFLMAIAADDVPQFFGLLLGRLPAFFVVLCLTGMSDGAAPPRVPEQFSESHCNLLSQRTRREISVYSGCRKALIRVATVSAIARSADGRACTRPPLRRRARSSPSRRPDAAPRNAAAYPDRRFFRARSASCACR